VGKFKKFLRVLLRLRHMVSTFRVPAAHVLQVVYGYTKGALASKTMVAIHRGDTLEAYHEEVLTFFIPPRTMLPLLNSEYYRAQKSDEPRSVYVSDIKEMAAALRQDSNEADVVRTILDGLHPHERNRLVFCERPRNYADLDNMCVYAHNIPSNDHNDITDSGTRRTSSSSSARAGSVNPAPHRASVVCYRCNKSGHIRRDCRVRLSAAAPSSSQHGNSIS
jgi:hypothetical protein